MPRLLADQMNWPVTYHGVNPVGQHCFANGTPMVSDTFQTLEAAVARFGRRIDVSEPTLKFSGPFVAGEKDANASRPYKPTRTDSQSIKEYGLGYIKGLIAKVGTPATKTWVPPIVSTPAPAPQPPPEPQKNVPPTQVAESLGTMLKRKRGRPRKDQSVISVD